MNIIHPIKDDQGITWAIMAADNRFMIVWQEPGKSHWLSNPEVFTDPDTAIKTLERRVAHLNAAYLQEKQERRK